MRVIALPTDEKEAQGIFGIFYAAAFQGEGAKDAAGARALGKLQDDLEAVATERRITEGEQTATVWELAKGVKEIRLEDARYEILKARIFGAGVPWLPTAVRRVAAAFDLVEAAVEEKPGAKPELVATETEG